MATFKILNACGGNKLPEDLDLRKIFLLNVDRCYKYPNTSLQNIKDQQIYPGIFYLKSDIFSFLSNSFVKFDYVYLYRFLEHTDVENVLSLIYLIASTMKKDAVLDILVPDFEKLSDMLLTLKNNFDYKKFNLIQSEFFADKTDPHRFVTTESTVRFFLELEDNFRVDSVERNFRWDCRDIYLRIKAKKL